MVSLLPLITKASLIFPWLTVDASSLVVAETLVAVARGPPPSLSASVIFSSSPLSIRFYGPGLPASAPSPGRFQAMAP